MIDCPPQTYLLAQYEKKPTIKKTLSIYTWALFYQTTQIWFI